MRRRITVAMVLMAVGTLALSGVVTLLLTVHQTRLQTRRSLVDEGQSLATTVRQEATTDNAADPARSLRTILVALKGPLRLQDEAVLAVRPTGVLFDPANPRQAVLLPPGLSTSDLSTSDLLAGRTVSGIDGSTVYAAVPYRTSVQITGVARDVVLVVVLTADPPTGLRSALPWLLLSSVAILVAAVIVADRLGRRFVRPLLAAQRVTGQIAAGDLDARVPSPPGTDPELAALTDGINAMAESLARARGAERQFLLSVSHDLRTPLTSIRGFAEAIEDGATEDVRRAAGVIATESRRLERLVQDLLALAHLETQQFSLDLRRVDLGRAAEAATDGFQPAADDLHLRLSYTPAPSGGPGSADPMPPDPTRADPPGGPIAVRADQDRLAQVIANLIENALKYARSEVGVGVARSGGYPVLWVDDDGPGIPPGDLPRVFDRLYTTAGRVGRPVGTGLGLAIVAELVAAIGATVRAESPLGADGGTRVVVTLPPWPDG